MQYFQDERGKLGVIDDRDTYFKIKRVFWITDVPPDMTRGHHTHQDCEQTIICIVGSFKVYLNGQEYTLSCGDSARAPAGCHIVLDNFSLDAVCLVLCSEYYNASGLY